MFETIRHDLRYGFRMLWKKPGFTVVAFATLVLGIGASTAIFSVINGVLLRPLPYKDVEQIVTVWQNNTARGTERDGVSPPNFLDYKERSQVFEAMAALRPYGLDYAGEGEPETFQSWLVTEGFFQILGVRALHGRTFVPEEYQPGSEGVVVMSHGLWRRRFGSDPSVVGRKLVLDRKPYTVVGIMPPEFHFTDKREMIAPAVFSESEKRRRSATYLNVIARLKPGATFRQAEAEMNNIAARLAQEYPQANRGVGVTLLSLTEQVIGQVRPALRVLFGAVGFVLLISCANVANLLFVRGAQRGREFAVRAALGAARGRLIRQLLTENIILALLSGVGGLLLAHWGIKLILALSPGNLPRVDQVGLDSGVLTFALSVSLLTALIFGLLPLLHFSSPNLQETLKEGGRSATAGQARHRLRNLLVVGEVALALVLLVGAGLLLRSFVRLLQVDPGFKTDNVLMLQAHVQDFYPTSQQQVAYFEQVLERLAALPGVKAAGAASAPPFVGEGSIEIDGAFAIEGQPPPAPGEEPTAYQTVVTADYFSALGISLSRGRLFNRTDGQQGAPVVLINETMARQYWPGNDPVGRRITLNWANQPFKPEIIGVVGDVRHDGLDSAPRPEVFMHLPQAPFGSMTFVVKTDADAVAVLPSVKREIWTVNRNQPFYKVRTAKQLVSDSLGERRFSLFLLGLFAAAALTLATTGIYGLISFSTIQRTHEIGVRIALGAQPRGILKMIIGEGLLLALVGVGVGLIGAFALTRFLSTMLFGVTATDPLTYASISTLLILTALLASYLPARRATKVDPTEALRHE